MRVDSEKYNDTKARYISALVIQNCYNKNRGLTYSRAVKENARLKPGIDFWLRCHFQKSDTGLITALKAGMPFDTDKDKKEKCL